MRIALIVAVFPPEPEPAAVMAGELTRNWVRAGHLVHVICPTPNRPASRVYPGYRRALCDRQIEDGRRVSRVWSWLIGSERKSINRILENVTFGMSSALELARSNRPDVVVVESWPILSYLPVLAVSSARRIPLVNYIQDVYPEAGISGGQIREGSLTARGLAILDRLICSWAARNVVISRGMKELMTSARRLPSERFFILENWIDVASIRPSDGSRWRKQMGIGKDEFVALYAGTMGFASGVDVLLDVATLLRDEKGIRLVCIGDGVLRERMERAVDARRLTNLTLLPFQPRDRISEAQSSADVAILTTAPGVGCSSVPSKLVTYLATGRPVVCAAAAESDAARLVAEGGLGEVVPPMAPAELAAALRRLRARSPEERAEMGRRAREMAERRFSVEAAVARFDQLFRDLSSLGRAGHLAATHRR